MKLGEAGLRQQPFRTSGRPLVFVPYAAQQAAIDFLSDTCKRGRGLGLFQGPPLSGKTAIIHHFAESLTDDSAIAIVDGAGLNTRALLEAVLSQFGYDLRFNSVNELINMVKVFVLQQTAANNPPLLIIENTHALNPTTLEVLCELADLKVRGKSALLLILASDRSITPIVDAPAMEPISKRITGHFHLEPMTKVETTAYLHAKLRAADCGEPQSLLPEDVCGELHIAADGWPGVLDRLVLLALAKADNCPIDKDDIEAALSPDSVRWLIVDEETADESTSASGDGAAQDEPPRLFLTYNGRTLREIDIDRPRVLVGRASHNDISVNSRFVSRHHAMFIRQGVTTILMDLNSTNGTYVNSRRVSNHVLIHDDVISVGHHGIKFHDPIARESFKLDGGGFADTVVMKNLRDVRRSAARKNTKSVSATKTNQASDSKK